MNPAREYLAELEIVNHASIEHIRHIRTALRAFGAAVGGEDEFDVPVNAAETDIKQWIASMRARNLQDRTVKTYVNAVRGFYDYLIESPDFKCNYNPCTRLSKRLPLGQTQTKRPFKTTAEVAGFIKIITHPRDRAIVTTLAKTGIRRGELCGLDLTDADLSHCIMGGTILRNANVKGTNFEAVKLTTVTVTHANFSEALNVEMPSFKSGWR